MILWGLHFSCSIPSAIAHFLWMAQVTIYGESAGAMSCIVSLSCSGLRRKVSQACLLWQRERNVSVTVASWYCPYQLNCLIPLALLCHVSLVRTGCSTR